jgi:hypothetical protein
MSLMASIAALTWLQILLEKLLGWLGRGYIRWIVTLLIALVIYLVFLNSYAVRALPATYWVTVVGILLAGFLTVWLTMRSYDQSYDRYRSWAFLGGLLNVLVLFLFPIIPFDVFLALYVAVGTILVTVAYEVTLKSMRQWITTLPSPATSAGVAAVLIFIFIMLLFLSKNGLSSFNTSEKSLSPEK